MKRLIVLAIAVGVLGLIGSRLLGPPAVEMAGVEPAQRASSPAPAVDAFDSNRAWEHLRQMVAIGPRPAGSPALRQTRAYLTRQLSSMGFTVEQQPFTATTPIGRIEMTNLIVRVPGRRTDRILLTGHYDTKLFRNQAFVGASDGASSAAWLIEAARILKSRVREFSYEVVWFDGEEATGEWAGNDHTYGSRYYVEEARRNGSLGSIRAMVLVDMIGDRDLQIRRDALSTPWLNDIVWAAAARTGHGSVFVNVGTQIEDDHMHFVQAGLPAVDIIDLDYPAWHTPDDNLDHVSAASLQVVGDVVFAALPDIEQRLMGGS